VAIGVRLYLSPDVLQGSWISSANLTISDAALFLLAGIIFGVLSGSLAAVISFGFATGIILPLIAVGTSIRSLVQRGAFNHVPATSMEVYILSIVVGVVTIAGPIVSWYTIGGALIFGTPIHRLLRRVPPSSVAGAPEPVPSSASVDAADPVADRPTSED